MGAEASKPQPGVPFQVIGAGFSRTGTSSFTAAISILLEGPAYHGGTQVVLGPPQSILSWLEMFSHWPSSNPDDKAIVKRVIKQELDGYVGVTDIPANELVEELLEIYPDAKVICTTRDPESWAKSIQVVSNVSTRWFLRFVLLPLPGLRHFPTFIDCLIRVWQHRYGDSTTVDAYHEHIAWLKRVVPEDRLFFVNVKDGWEPICKALGKEIPSVPFPHVNDAKATEEIAQKMVVKGLKRWAVVASAVVVGAAGVWYGRQ